MFADGVLYWRWELYVPRFKQLIGTPSGNADIAIYTLARPATTTVLLLSVYAATMTDYPERTSNEDSNNFT